MLKTLLFVSILWLPLMARATAAERCPAVPDVANLESGEFSFKSVNGEMSARMDFEPMREKICDHRIDREDSRWTILEFAQGQSFGTVRISRETGETTVSGRILGLSQFASIPVEGKIIWQFIAVTDIQDLRQILVTFSPRGTFASIGGDGLPLTVTRRP